MRHAGARHLQADAQHCFFEQLPIFSLRDRLGICADQFHSMPRERAITVQLHRHIECGLSAHGWQNRVRFFAFHDRLDHFCRDWLDVSAIGKLRIGHDRRRVRVHEHDLIAFFAQRLAGLHARIIKFAALPDHDWTRADEQDFLEIVIPRHLLWHRHPACVFRQLKYHRLEACATTRLPPSVVDPDKPYKYL